jgi:glycerophosphoryl diester phosphodiesterase
VTSHFLDHPRPVAFAHRGGAAHNPENSWRAFEYAVKLGYAYLETDLRATSDGMLLAFHDATLDRVTGTSGKVAETPYRAIKDLRVHGSEPIPLLEDLLSAWPGVRFNVDLKHVGAIEPLNQVLARTAARHRVCVTSFSGKRLVRARALLGPEVQFAVTLGLGAAARYAGFLPAQMAARVARSGVNCVQIPGKMATASFISRAQQAGMHVHVWTVNSKTQMERVLDLKADGVMTDKIVVLRGLLSARGQWHPPADGLSHALFSNDDAPYIVGAKWRQLTAILDGNRDLLAKTRLGNAPEGNLVRVFSVAGEDR